MTHWWHFTARNQPIRMFKVRRINFNLIKIKPHFFLIIKRLLVIIIWYYYIILYLVHFFRFICLNIKIRVLKFSDGLWILIVIFFCIELQATSLSYNKGVIENSDVSETLVKVSGVFWFHLSWSYISWKLYQTIKSTVIKRQLGSFDVYLYIFCWTTNHELLTRFFSPWHCWRKMWTSNWQCSMSYSIFLKDQVNV